MQLMKRREGKEEKQDAVSPLLSSGSSVSEVLPCNRIARRERGGLFLLLLLLQPPSPTSVAASCSRAFLLSRHKVALSK